MGMKAELGTSGAAAPAPVAVAAAPVASSASLENAAATVIAVIAEKTGYDDDTVEESMSLEMELGIDSIKRVEILSEVQRQLGVDKVNDLDALSRTQTVGEVIAAMKAELA